MTGKDGWLKKESLSEGKEQRTMGEERSQPKFVILTLILQCVNVYQRKREGAWRIERVRDRKHQLIIDWKTERTWGSERFFL